MKYSLSADVMWRDLDMTDMSKHFILFIYLFIIFFF